MEERPPRISGAPPATSDTPEQPNWPAFTPVAPNSPSDVFDTSTDTWQLMPPDAPADFAEPQTLAPGVLPPPQFPPPGPAWYPPTVYPAPPGMSSGPLYPQQQPGMPSQPLYPPPPGAGGAYPGYPAYPGYTGAPSMPPPGTGAPWVPLPPGTGAPAPQVFPGYPGYPSYPGYPAYPGYAPYPSPLGAPDTIPLGPYSHYLTAAPAEAPQPPSSLVRPFAPGLAACLFVGSLALVGFVAGTDIAALRADWSDGATAAGYTALFLAAVTLFVGLLRILLGRRARSTYVLGGLMLAVLIATGASCLSFAAPLHGVQAHAHERQKAWAAAIHEYALTGESAPNAPNIARVYVEWGEQQLAQHAYGGAVIHFGIVISEYGRSGDLVTRAKQELYATYTAWLGADDANLPYADAISALMSHQTEPGCDAACQTATQALEMQARFQFDTQLAAKGNYPDAITQFETIETKFAKSEYAAQAHKAAAQAYFAHGQSQLASACSQALTDYQTLVKRYADTAEGKQAGAALAAGVDVSGVLTSMPANPLPTLHLSKHIDKAIFFLSSEYTTTPDASGNYTFHHVAPGNYNIASTHLNGGVIEYVWWYRDDFYTVHVGQLCAVSVGQLDYKA
ncbi:MAG TPA: hypothetical protein VE258_12065 [Ktedonobacterales bacterium]|nr:hypothetical protein [Ktedonobacterales bacterium]